MSYLDSHANQTARSILDIDTSFNERYDEPGVDVNILSGISQDQRSILHQNFDYKYLDFIEGTSARNIKRQREFRDYIDHINNPNKFLREKMGKFYTDTKAWNLNRMRDSRLDQASKELERQ